MMADTELIMISSQSVYSVVMRNWEHIGNNIATNFGLS